MQIDQGPSEDESNSEDRDLLEIRSTSPTQLARALAELLWSEADWYEHTWSDTDNQRERDAYNGTIDVLVAAAAVLSGRISPKTLADILKELAGAIRSESDS